MLCPDSIRFAYSRRPGEHRLVEFDSDRGAEKLQHAVRVLQNIICIDDRRNRAGPFAYETKNFALLNEPKIFQDRIGILFDVGEDHFPRIADEKAVYKIDNPLALYLWKQVVSHLFLKKYPLLIRQRRFRQRRDDFVQIGFSRRNDFLRNGMLFPSPL